MTRAVLILLIVWAGLGLAGGAMLHASNVVDLPRPDCPAATVVIGLGVVPLMLAVSFFRGVARPLAPRPIPDWLTLLFVYAAFDVVRSVLAPLTGWPIAAADLWTLWMFVYGACLMHALDLLRATRCPAGHPVALDATWCRHCRTRLDTPTPASARATGDAEGDAHPLRERRETGLASLHRS